LWYDQTGGFVTGVAVANMTAASASIPVTVRDDAGNVLATSTLPTLNAYGHTSFLLTDPAYFPATAGGRGTIELQVPAGGQIAALAFRAALGTLSTIPSLANSGSAGAPGTLATVGAMSHLATAGGWQTTFMLINMGTAASQTRLALFDDNGDPFATPLCLPQTSSSSAVQASEWDQPVAAGAALVVETCATGATSQEGWAQLQTNGNLTGFARFDWTTAQGLQEALVPLESRTPNSFVLWYDQTGGFVTGVAVANMTAASASIPVTVRDDAGNVLATSTLPTLNAYGHTSFLLTDAAYFPATAGKRGTIELQVPAGGQIGTLAFRAALGTLSTIPAMVK
jgi:hypothetical protein